MKISVIFLLLLVLYSLEYANSQTVVHRSDAYTERIMDILASEDTDSLDAYHSSNVFDIYNTRSALVQAYEETTDLVLKRQIRHWLDQYDFEYAYDHPSVNSDDKEYNTSKPVLKYFYRNRNHLYSVKTPHFSMNVDPLLNIHVGKSSDGGEVVFQNTRGAQIHGRIDDKVYFLTQLFENQASFLPYVDRYITTNNTLPGNGLFKDFNSQISDNLKGYDYLNAAGHLGMRISKHINLEFGHGKHFIGNGIRSLLLSDFSNNYFYLNLKTQVWKFHYQNIYAELSALSSRDVPGDFLVPKKYMAAHYLTFRPSPKWEIGLFESVIFSRESHLELQYLNPIILYRAIEHQLGSPDNVLLGLNSNWYFIPRAKIYGQVLVDELIFGQIKNQWWGNKFGGQIGVKVYDILGVNGLDFQLETNNVRPYTYAQSRVVSALPSVNLTGYTHEKQALAHPLGANFREWLVQVDQYIDKQWQVSITGILYSQGVDTDTISYGGNIWRNTEDRNQEEGISILQGSLRQTMMANLRVSYSPFPNLHLDLNTAARREKGDDQSLSYGMISLGLRYQMIPQIQLY